MEDKNPRLTLVARGSIIYTNIGNRACGLPLKLKVQFQLKLPSSSSSRRLLFAFVLLILLYFPDEFQAFQYESESAYRNRKF